MASHPAACFGENLRHYKLSFRGGLALSRSEAVSAIHKLHRRDMGPELLGVCRGFFDAASGRAGGDTPQLKSAATNFVNRIGIAVFEEGTFLHLTLARQRAVVAHLRDAHLARGRGEWEACYENVREVVRLTSGVPRGRLGSVAARHVHDGRPVPAEARAAARALDARAIALASESREAALASARSGLQTAEPLLQRGCKFAESAEFRRQVHQCAAVAPFVLAPIEAAPPAQLSPREPSLVDDLLPIGVRDCHVSGKDNPEGWAVFLSRGCRVANPTRARVFGMTYAELEKNYVDGKLADVRSGAAAALARASRKRLEQPARVAPAEMAPRAPRAFDLVAPGPGDGILGFKNATCCGVLKRGFPPLLEEGARVFMKLGESASDCAFSARCYSDMAALAMPSVAVLVTEAIFSRDAWASFGAATDVSDGRKWTAAMLRKMGKHDGQPVATQICEEFAGGRRLQAVAEGDPLLDSPHYGRTLMHAALFSKRVGAKDFQPFNLLVGPDGKVLQVDLNRASPLQIAAYNGRGLQTSRSFGKRFWDPVRNYAREQSVDLARFVAELAERVPLAAGVRTPIFGEEARALLAAGHGEEFLAMAAGANSPSRAEGALASL